MSLNSALEDLRGTTLKAITGGLRRLEYLSDLRNGAGTYLHWGLARVHGQFSASKALAQEHRSVVSRLLATPLQELIEDLDRSSDLAGVPREIYIEQLFQRGARLLPQEPAAGSERHLNSVLRALSGLAQAQLKDANRPIA